METTDSKRRSLWALLALLAGALLFAFAVDGPANWN